MIISINEIFNFYDLYKSSWGGAIKNLDIIKKVINNYCVHNEFCEYMNEIIDMNFNGSIDRTKLNDIFWFDDDFILELINNIQDNKHFNNYEEMYDYYNS